LQGWGAHKQSDASLTNLGSRNGQKSAGKEREKGRELHAGESIEAWQSRAGVGDDQAKE